MNSTIRKLSALILLSAFVLTTTACNTMAGVGKDTQKAGEKIEEEAERNNDSTKS